MQTYRCTCGNRLFFDNTRCLACQAEVLWCEGCHRLTALAIDGNQPWRCSHGDCGRLLQKCANYAGPQVCNRAWPLESEPDAEGLCHSCRLTETIPDLSIDGHHEKWARLEAAKRRLLYTLDRLGLRAEGVDPPLTFDFKADPEQPADHWRDAGPKEVVYTGHCNGKITINIREADDAERERLRVTFHEAHRTLIGHFHHEVGHYYWQLLVQGRRRREQECVRTFGDHNAPPYAEAMAAYYRAGPRDDWPSSFISAYASSHPWEDFAETFALYLDIMAVLDTASHLYKGLRPQVRSRSVAPLVAQFLEVGVLGNEINRTLGLIDLAPKLIVPPVVDKLQFVHKIVKQAGGRHGARAALGAAPAAAQPLLQGQQQLEPVPLALDALALPRPAP